MRRNRIVLLVVVVGSILGSYYVWNSAVHLIQSVKVYGMNASINVFMARWIDETELQALSVGEVEMLVRERWGRMEESGRFEDTWGADMRVAAEKSGHKLVIHISSSGPDKSWGTRDDIVRQREWIFAAPAESQPSEESSTP